MEQGDEEKECTVCGGTGVSEPVLQDINKIKKKGDVKYQPIECQHCKGSKKEPKLK